MKGWLATARLNYGQKLFLLATLPLILTAVAVSVVVTLQARQMAEREIETLEAQLISAKRAELKNYISIARTAFVNIYGRAAPDDREAMEQVSQILAAMLYGQDGYFFVFDYNGTNLVSPRRTELIGRNWTGLEDSSGVPVTDELIRLARSGGGYHSFIWPKPSTGERTQMVAYVIGLQDWQWAIGTGVFIDDVIAAVAASRQQVETRVQRTFFYVGGATMLALIFVFVTGLFITIRERRLANAKLKMLTQRVFDAQEEERGRVARELHDGISQILVGVRYALETARRRLAAGDARAGDTLDRGAAHLSTAIQEVRRISRDLRPGALDDLGLGPALKALAEDFGRRTGIETQFATVVFRNRLDEEAKIALYRIAQETLTNIERHSAATRVHIDLRGHASGGTLRITDNGCGIDAARASAGGGLGLRNMQERIEQIDGRFEIRSSPEGTEIEATVPLTHLLTPQGQSETAPETKRATA
ncbi:cache domain-containing protein [Roseovarius nitratireducens]|uniref:cache domain-containing protein n=1 Tax=Roseovarius nitratireducens TaxID=2044597 RepID=UPI000CE1DF0E|nr:cache domain-containing protein [Roseovarius nitratireducens]